MKLLLALITLISSSLLYFGASHFGLWSLMWIAPVPILIFSLTQRAQHTIVTAFLIGLAPPFLATVASSPTHELSYFLTTEALVHAVVFSVQILIYRAICRNFHHMLSIFVYPCLIVLTELIWASLSYNGSLWSIAYSQIHFLAEMQFASLFGYLGVSFLVSLFAGSLSLSLYCLPDKHATSITGIVMMGVIEIATISFGFTRLAQAHHQHQINAGIVAIQPSKFNTNIRSTIHQLKQQGAQVVIFPEKTRQVNTSNTLQIKNTLSNLARNDRIMLAIGVNNIQAYGKYNSAWVFDHQGRLFGKYNKSRIELNTEKGYLTGKSHLTLTTQFGKIGFGIGDDFDFTNPAQRYGAKGVGLVLLLGQTSTKAQIASAISRGIENGFSVVRSAQTGVLFASNQYGQVLSIKPISTSKPTDVLLTVPVYEGKTFYSMYGHNFPWFCLVLFLTLALMAYRHKGEQKKDLDL